MTIAGEYRMPPGAWVNAPEQIADTLQINLVRSWIEAGAPKTETFIK